jgi:universal stress protein E
MRSAKESAVQQIRRILVAIGDLQRAPKNELRRAGTLARAAGASVELFHAIDQADPARSFPETATAETVEKLRSAIAARHLRRLERFAHDESLRGASVTCAAVWGYPPYQAVIRRALARRADLVIAATRAHRFGARLLLRNTDWELIRHCPVPLLLVKSRRPYQKPLVLAAVDPFHAHARPADLDARLLSAAGRFSRLLRGATHLFHAYMPLIAVEAFPVSPAPPVMLPPAVEAAHAQQIERAINQLGKSAGIPPGRRHVCLGDVATELSALTRRTHTDLVVMGAVSRSALARVFIGSTAERVLDKLSCDVLIVKPRGVRSELAGRKTATRESAKGRRASPPRTRRQPDSTVTSLRIVLPPLA